jgi:hypothetical protein
MAAMTDGPTVFRPDSVSYLRIPAPDPAKSAAFYGALFDWEVDPWFAHRAVSSININRAWHPLDVDGVMLRYARVHGVGIPLVLKGPGVVPRQGAKAREQDDQGGGEGERCDLRGHVQGE